MTGFDNGTLQSGVSAQVKQFGAILRGYGPPTPVTGVVGDVYVDAQTFNLYNKRAASNTDPWGHYLFQVPVTYQSTLKWFSSSPPTNDVGVTGDYCLLWGGWANYGMQPSIFGPKLASGWPENGDGPDTVIDPTYAGAAFPVGLVGEGAAMPNSTSTQLVVVGLSDEFILAVPVLLSASSPVSQLGLQYGPVNVSVLINPLYAAEDEHKV